MLVQKHREYKKDASKGCFAVGKSREEIFKDLKYSTKRLFWVGQCSAADAPAPKNIAIFILSSSNF